MELLLCFGAPFLAAFLLQLLVGCGARHRALRHLPLYGFGVTLVFAAAAAAADPGFLIGGNLLAAVVWFLVGLCLLLGYGLAMTVHRIIRK